MTVDLPILYRVAEGGPFDLEVDNGVTIENITDDLVNAKILIPDTRLQAIKDAPRCEHGRIDWHWVEDKVRGMPLVGRWRCDGAPELRVLLNTLTKETADG